MSYPLIETIDAGTAITSRTFGVDLGQGRLSVQYTVSSGGKTHDAFSLTA